jgi:hypothetical protein
LESLVATLARSNNSFPFPVCLIGSRRCTNNSPEVWFTIEVPSVVLLKVRFALAIRLNGELVVTNFAARFVNRHRQPHNHSTTGTLLWKKGLIYIYQVSLRDCRLGEAAFLPSVCGLCHLKREGTVASRRYFGQRTEVSRHRSFEATEIAPYSTIGVVLCYSDSTGAEKVLHL